MSDLPAKKSATPLELADLPFWWEHTTAPTVPFRLGISVKVNVTSEAIKIHATRDGSNTLGALLGENLDVDERLEFAKSEIEGIDVYLMPDVPDEADPSWRGANSSWVVIRHRDPFGVEPFFKSLFVSEKAYWPKALAKLLRERLGVTPTMANEDATTRQRRLTRESSADQA